MSCTVPHWMTRLPSLDGYLSPSVDLVLPHRVSSYPPAGCRVTPHKVFWVSPAETLPGLDTHPLWAGVPDEQPLWL